MNRIKLLISVIMLCSLIQNSTANSYSNSQIGYNRVDIPIRKSTGHRAGCDTPQNNTLVTAPEMVLKKANGGIACTADGGDWFWVALEAGHPSTAAIWDGQAQVYFNLMTPQAPNCWLWMMIAATSPSPITENRKSTYD